MTPRGWLDVLATRAWPRRSVAWIGGLLIAATVAQALHDVAHSHDVAVEATVRELDAQARVLAEQTARSVQAVDVVLRHLANEHRSGALAKLSEAQLHALLREQAVGMVQAGGLTLHDGTGRPRALSWMFPAPATAHVGDRANFRRIAGDPNQEVYVGDSDRSRTDGIWFFPVVRRLAAPDGRFDGIVAARARVDYFQDFYRDVQPDPNTRIALLHREGSLLARHPPVERLLGRRMPEVSALFASAAAGTLPARQVSPVDGIDRFGAVRIVPDYDLVVVVSRSAAAALGPWRAQALGTALRTLALAGLAALLLALVLRQLKRLTAAHQSLAVSEERYALAAAGSDDGIWDWDLEAGTAYESRRARELQGLPLEPETQPLTELRGLLTYHPDDAALRADTMQAHLDGHTPAYEVEYRVRHADGAYRWIRVRALCIRDAAGKPLRIAGSVSDIDAAKRAEVALRESEERFAVAVAGSDDGIWDWNYATDTAYSSARGREILGAAPARDHQTIAEWFALMSDHLHPDDLPRRNAALEDHLAGRAPAYAGEFRVRQADGSYRWARVRGMCVRDAAGKPLRIAGSVSDIDAQKRAEAALRRSEERYQLAVDGSNEGLWDWDLPSDLLFLSPRAQQLTLAEVGEPLRPRREWIALTTYHPDDLGPVRRAIVEHLRGQTPHFAVEYRLRHHSGEWHWYRQRGVALRDAEGRAYRMAGSMEDISARKRAEAERERLEQQLHQAQKLEAIGTLAGGIAHDFNNILAAILGYGELAQRDAAEGTRQRRHLDAALSAGMRAKSLVERILAFSRSGMNERVPVHVQSVVQEALDGVAATLPAGVQLERRLAAGDAGVLGDPTQIHQVVMNLCANAVQAMRAEGRLAVALDVAESDTPRMVSTNTLPPGAYVRLAVADTGTGIAPQVLERIFDPFFTTKAVGVGTGLGLSLVHGIVTDLGGGIAVESQPGRGTTLTVYLPTRAFMAAPAPEPEAPAARGEGETVLLVDDEEALVRLGEEMLAELGYEPVGFASSPEALARFRAEPERFDAVLSDEAMPEMTGSELAAEVRRLRPGIPIVLMSGFVSPVLAARAEAAGVAEVLNKPLVSRDIARALAQALQAARLGLNNRDA